MVIHWYDTYYIYCIHCQQHQKWFKAYSPKDKSWHLVLSCNYSSHNLPNDSHIFNIPDVNSNTTGKLICRTATTKPVTPQFQYNNMVSCMGGQVDPAMHWLLTRNSTHPQTHRRPARVVTICCISTNLYNRLKLDNLLGLLLVSNIRGSRLRWRFLN